jgi:hypothetical protein
MVLVGVVAFVINAAVSCFIRWPEPYIHDEFSYLLAADTFAHGRITNPTHPMWIHFESFHILQQPTYMSMYPPAQGVTLAVGQVLTGYPLAGSWLSMGFACAALVWMLLAWLPPRWALLGGVIAAIHPLTLEWAQSYMGGATAMAGGALVLGAFRRLSSEYRPHTAVVMGVGMAILANSRPYEGLVLSATASTALFIWALRSKTAWRIILKRVVLPLGLVLLPTALAMGYYNFRITGNPLLLPEILGAKTYQVVPIFLWQKPGPTPSYHHEVMKEFYTKFGFENYLAQRTLRGFIERKYAEGSIIAQWYFPLGVAAPLLMLPWILRREPWVRIAVLILGVFIVGLLLSTWSSTRYTAPAFALIWFIWLACLRRVSQWRWRGAAIGACVAFFFIAVYLFAGAMEVKINAAPRFQADKIGVLREQIVSQYIKTGGKYLLVVRYGPKHDYHREIVYNAADIDASPVVWARDMGEAGNRELLDYFSDREAWLIDIE